MTITKYMGSVTSDTILYTCPVGKIASIEEDVNL